MRVFLDIAVTPLLVRYAAEEKANALMETVLVFPVLLALLMGTFDMGTGIILNQKTIGASQIIGDLIARNKEIDEDGLQDMIRAGELAYDPYPVDSFGYDIVSIRFDEDGDPVVLWRVTENMEENENALESTDGLGAKDEGLIIVTTSYEYIPYFSNFFVSNIDMSEVAFLKPRRSATVICDDCPS